MNCRLVLRHGMSIAMLLSLVMLYGCARPACSGMGVNQWVRPSTQPATSPASRPSISPATTRAAQRVSVGQAGVLITQFIEGELRDIAMVKVRETTPPEFWDRLQMQTFVVTEGFQSGVNYQIHDGKVMSLGLGFGGVGMDNGCVADLLGTGTPQLYYCFEWGSGIPHGQVGMWSEATGEIRSDFIVFYDMVELDHPDQKTIRVNTMPLKLPGMTIGTLAVRQEPGKPPVLEVKLAENLPADLRENIKLLSELRAATQPSTNSK